MKMFHQKKIKPEPRGKVKEEQAKRKKLGEERNQGKER